MVTDDPLVPATLHSYPVLHSRVMEPGSKYSVVLCYRHQHEVHPFVVATYHWTMGDSWHQGDYYAALPDAMKAFDRRKL
jgi:hypothetical protein